MRFCRDCLSDEKRTEKSLKMTEFFLKSDVYRDAERLFLFVSKGTEIETAEIMKQAWADGKTVAVPKTEGRREMFFLPIGSREELVKGRYGILEPAGGRERELIPEKGDVFLVPGLAFDRAGNRIGCGGGYYDIYFEKHAGMKKIGLAFAFQVSTEPLPTKPTDIPVNMILTEQGWNGGEET